MKIIIDKLDYMLSNSDVSAKKTLWESIKNSSYIMKTAREVIKDRKSGKLTVISPSICNLILSLPDEITKEIYRNTVKKALSNEDISRLVVSNNKTFLELVLMNNSVDLEDYEQDFVVSEIHKLLGFKPEKVNEVKYKEIVMDDSKNVVAYKDESISVSVNEKEEKYFASDESKEIVEVEQQENQNSLIYYFLRNHNFSEETKYSLINTMFIKPFSLEDFITSLDETDEVKKLLNKYLEITSRVRTFK